MRTFIFAVLGLVIVAASTSISPIMGFNGSAAAFRAGQSATYDSSGQRLSSTDARKFKRNRKKPSGSHAHN
jgi:hypothetical protein